MSTQRNIVSESEDVVTSIRLTREQHEAVKALAVAQTRTFTQQMRVIVADALASQAQVEKAA
ncbi:MAG TPA: hypothetical protein VNJ54_15125 [Plantibacter sp.]|uniref:hypothetical protein n=1 Tax=Plantibacter sp. TaxID=1871045 RepID=UPI002C8D8569|nr:hypothetical protein [Plantibacter sp.]